MVSKPLVIGGLLGLLTLVVTACDANTRSPTPDVELLAGGDTWILETLDGLSPIEESPITLLVQDDLYRGFDGCNYYGGRSKDGAPIAGADGKLTVPNADRTVMYCPEPKGVMDQAKVYMSALLLGDKYRIVDGRLEILDSGGAIRLVFVKQTP